MTARSNKIISPCVAMERKPYESNVIALGKPKKTIQLN